MLEVGLKNIEKSYGGRKILKAITLEIQTGDKMGMIGRNGTGKTTIFKIMAGLESYDSGELSLRKGITVSYLDQIPVYPGGFKTIDVLNSAFAGIFEIGEKMKELEEMLSGPGEKEMDKVMALYGELQAEYERLGGYEIESNLDRVCSGLQIGDELRCREFNSLSGGEKSRVVLGKILLEKPDVLLLDEPTNHLDMDSVEWLEEFLNEYEGSVVIISHDRYFLDRVVSKIVEIEDGEAVLYHGNYSYYVKEKGRRLMARFEIYKNQQKKIKAMEEAIKRYRDWGNRSGLDKHFRRAADIEKRIQRMEKVEKPILERRKAALGFHMKNRSGNDVFSVVDLDKRFGENPVLQGVNFQVKFGDSVAIIGKNGSGKSTFFRLLLGQIEADAGTLQVGNSVKIGYLEQEIKFNNEEATVLETFRENLLIEEGKARGELAKFLFFRRDVFKKVKNLSGGEKARLKLCQLMHRDINLLLLDEPTNHLDIDSREMFEEALADFIGTLVFISHDRYFINKLVERIAEIENKNFKIYHGNYNYYKQKKTEEMRIRSEKERMKKTGRPKKNEKRDNTDARRLKKAERKIKELESEIHQLEKRLVEIDKDMEKYPTDYEKQGELFSEKCNLQKKIDIMLEEWSQLNDWLGK